MTYALPNALVQLTSDLEEPGCYMHAQLRPIHLALHSQGAIPQRHIESALPARHDRHPRTDIPYYEVCDRRLDL